MDITIKVPLTLEPALNLWLSQENASRAVSGQPAITADELATDYVLSKVRQIAKKLDADKSADLASRITALSPADAAEVEALLQSKEQVSVK